MVFDAKREEIGSLDRTQLNSFNSLTTEVHDQIEQSDRPCSARSCHSQQESDRSYLINSGKILAYLSHAIRYPFIMRQTRRQ